MVKESREIIFYKGKPTVEEADHGAEIFVGLVKKVESWTSLVVKETGLAEPETMEREQHLVGLRQRSMDEARSDFV